MEQKEIIYAQGDIQNAIKRLGVNKSNLFCTGTDSVLNSGVIVSQGKIVSSKILDITIRSGKNNIIASSTSDYLNKVVVTYINSDTKRIETEEFKILNTDALIEIVQIIKNNKEQLEKLEKTEKNVLILDEKVSKMRQFLDENENQILCIRTLKDQICELTNKLDYLIAKLR